jgi:hypothetical protein
MLRRRTTCGWLSGASAFFCRGLREQLAVLLGRGLLDLLGRDQLRHRRRRPDVDPFAGQRPARPSLRRWPRSADRATARVQRAGACRIAPAAAQGARPPEAAHRELDF